MKNSLIFIGIILAIYSCANKQEIKHNESKKINIGEVDTSKKGSAMQNNSAFIKVLNKMRKKGSLNESDFALVGIFLITNNDESLSEEAGYTFYNFFKKNEQENLKFKTYLNKTKIKLEILNALVEIMCLDLGEDSYTGKKLETDFLMFKNEKETLKLFESCISA